MLRVISGTAKGHKLRTVKGDTTRPTSDRVKESLFNILAAQIVDADVLDLYAGTGNLGIEALSRGARSAVFVDKSLECYSIIKENLIHTRLSEKAEVMTGEVEAVLSRLSGSARKFDIIFMDPPYSKSLIGVTLDKILRCNILKPNTIIVAERDMKDEIPEDIGILKLFRNQKYGDTVLSFYSVFGKEDQV